MGDLYQGHRDPENDPLRPVKPSDIWRYMTKPGEKKERPRNNNTKYSTQLDFLREGYEFGKIILFELPKDLYHKIRHIIKRNNS